MDEVAATYDRFKLFISAEVPDSWMLSFATSVPADVFLRGLAAYGQDDDGGTSTVEAITDKVLTVAGLDRSAFTDASIIRFQRYIEYFQLVARQMYE